MSDDLLKSYLDSYVDTPWDALKYLIAEANYGGRVTDELDRRVLNSYLNKFYCDDALTLPHYRLSPLPTYYVPDVGSLQSFKDYIVTLPSGDRPEAFGQHPNAEISYLIEDSKVVLDSLLSLQPRTGGAAGGGVKREDLVASIAADLLEQVRRSAGAACCLVTLLMSVYGSVRCSAAGRGCMQVALLCRDSPYQL